MVTHCRTSRFLLITYALLGGGCALTSPEEEDVVARAMTFDEFVSSLPVDEETGAFVLDGDILAYDRADLTDHYASHLYGTALTLDQTGPGVDNKYSVAQADQLTYCVSNAFGSQKVLVRDAFAAAAQEWMDATKISAKDAPTIRFRHIASEDANCTPFNGNVFFNIAPSSSTKFDAVAFFPHYARGKRQVLLTDRAIQPFKSRTLAGVLRHEIGHILGFKHEHINKAATPCPERDADWRPVTEYDVPSVMHYRDLKAGQCANYGTSDYVLTTHDNAGVRCVYTTQARAGMDRAGDACRALTAYSPAASSFAVDGNGALYRLALATRNGQRTAVIARYLAPGTASKQGWKTIWSATEPYAETTTSIAAGGSELYRRTTSGLYRWSAGAWEAIPGGPGEQVVVAYSSGDLFRLNGNGTIDRVQADDAGPRTLLATAAAGRRLFPGTTELYRVEANGDAYAWAAGSWSARMGTGIRAIAKTESGSVFCLLDDAAGTVMLRKAGGAWSTIGSRARALWGGLEVPYASMQDDPKTSADESTTIRRNSTGSIWHRYALSSTRIMKGSNRRVAINTNKRPYGYATP